MKMPSFFSIVGGVFIVILTLSLHPPLYSQTTIINPFATPASSSISSTAPTTLSAQTVTAASQNYPSVTTYPTTPVATTTSAGTTGLLTTASPLLTAQQIQALLTEAASSSLTIFGTTAEERSKLQIYQQLLMGIFSDKTGPNVISNVLLNFTSDIGYQSATLRTMPLERLAEAKKAIDYGKKLAEDTVRRYNSQKDYALTVQSLTQIQTTLNTHSTNIDRRVKLNQDFVLELNKIKLSTSLPEKISRYRKLNASINAQILEPTMTNLIEDLGRLIMLIKQLPSDTAQDKKTISDLMRDATALLAEIELNAYVPTSWKTKVTELKTSLLTTTPTTSQPLTGVAPTLATVAPILTGAAPTTALTKIAAPTALPPAASPLVATALTPSATLAAQPLPPLLTVPPTTPASTRNLRQLQTLPLTAPTAPPAEPVTAITPAAADVIVEKDSAEVISLDLVKKNFASADPSYSLLITTCASALNLLKTKLSKEDKDLLVKNLTEKLALAYNTRSYKKPEDIIELYASYQKAAEIKELTAVATKKRLETLKASAQISIAQTQKNIPSKLASLSLAINLSKKDADSYEKTLLLDELMGLFTNRDKYTEEEQQKVYALLTSFSSKENQQAKVFDQATYKKVEDWASVVHAYLVLSATPVQKNFKDLLNVYRELFDPLALPTATYERVKFKNVFYTLFCHRVNLYQADLKELKVFFELILQKPGIVSTNDVAQVIKCIRRLDRPLSMVTDKKTYLEALMDGAKEALEKRDEATAFKNYSKVARAFTTHTAEAVLTLFIGALNELIKYRASLKQKAELAKLLKLTGSAKYVDTLNMDKSNTQGADIPLIAPNSPRDRALKDWLVTIEHEVLAETGKAVDYSTSKHQTAQQLIAVED